MRKTALFFLILSTCVVANAQTLFTYGNKAVSKNEFVNAFNKNPTADTTSRKTSLKNYLDLYIRYKLKVQAALDEKLNERDEYKSEAENFKREMAETAINNEANVNSLVREAFLRSRKDVQLAQIFIPVAQQNDTTTAFTQINNAYGLLKSSKPFNEVLMQFTTDSTARKNGGNIGYITAFTLPYEAENIVYNLHPGDYAKPYRSQNGYHIFKAVSERLALGVYKIQQLLLAVSPNASGDEKNAVKRKADSVYQLLQSGASFAGLQVVYGLKKDNNQNTISVAVGQYSPDFENAVFALQKEGDYSHPFVTAYGYNIIKLIKKEKPVTDTADLTVKAAIQEKVSADNRLAVAKKTLENKWRIATAYQPVAYNNNDLWAFTDTVIASGKIPARYKTITDKTILFSFKKRKILVADWIRFMQMKMGEGITVRDYKQLMPEFVTYATTNYYKDHIEDFHPELKPQLDEFNDANLLFSAMDKQVWSKAAADTISLLQYYKSHPDKYVWLPGADAIFVKANNKQVADELAFKLKDKPTDWHSLTNTYGSLAQADSSRFEWDQLPLKKTAEMGVNYLSEPVRDSEGDGYSFLYIVKVYNKSEPRSFEDAKGLVINNYQQVLEDNWIKNLKKKYPVKVNEAVFNNIP